MIKITNQNSADVGARREEFATEGDHGIGGEAQVMERDSWKMGKGPTEPEDWYGVDWTRWYDEQAAGRLRVDEAEEKRMNREEHQMAADLGGDILNAVMEARVAGMMDYERQAYAQWVWDGWAARLEKKNYICILPNSKRHSPLVIRMEGRRGGGTVKAMTARECFSQMKRRTELFTGVDIIDPRPWTEPAVVRMGDPASKTQRDGAQEAQQQGDPQGMMEKYQQIRWDRAPTLMHKGGMAQSKK